MPMNERRMHCEYPQCPRAIPVNNVAGLVKEARVGDSPNRVIGGGESSGQNAQ